MEIEQVRCFINSVKWQEAKTYRDTFPHEYTVSNWIGSRKDLFNKFYSFVEYIRKNGYQKKFFKKTYTYLDVDGYQYWTMGNPICETTVINREKIKNG